MNQADKEILASIENVLVNDQTSPRKALLAAYELGKLAGMMQVAGVVEEKFGELLMPDAFDSTLKIMRGH